MTLGIARLIMLLCFVFIGEEAVFSEDGLPSDWRRQSIPGGARADSEVDNGKPPAAGLELEGTDVVEPVKSILPFALSRRTTDG